MANEFVARNGIIAKDNSTITGTLAVSGNITMGGLLVATQSWVTTRGYATESYVTTAINNLIDSAPGALDTLNELAAALGDDPNFATTVTNSIASKVSKSGDTMTGNINWNTQNTGLTWNMNTDGAYIKFFNTGDGDTNSRLEYSTSDNGDEYHRWVISGVEKMNLKWGGLTVTDTIYASGGNSSNWNTAYGWGNHASAGYQSASTAVELFDYLWTNPVFGQYGIKNNLIDNILYSAQQRFTVLKNGGAYGGDLFNANYDQWQDIIPAGQSATYTIQFNTKNNPSYGIVYPWGKIYLSFYYIQIPASVVGRSKDQNGVWSNLSGWTNVANNGSYAVWSADINGSNYLVELEITITAAAGIDTWFAQWEYVLGRPGQFENGIISKFQDNSIWRSLFFKDSNNNNRVNISSNGIVTDQQLTINGTNSLYFGSYGGGWYMADGSWVRTVSGKSVWTGGGVLGSDGGLTIGYGGTSHGTGNAVIAGVLGVGTSSPSYKLQVNGNAAFATNSGGLRIDSYDADTAVIRPSVANGSVLISDDSGTLARGTEFLNGGGIVVQSLSGFAPLEVKSNSTSRLSVAANGYVGIGISNPLNVLEVRNGSGTTGYSGNDLVFYNGNGQSAFYHDAGGYVYWYSNQAITFYPGASRSVTFSTNGRVGIGTTDPQQKLDVDGNISLGSWTKAGSTYVGLRRADDGSFGGGGDSGLVIESYNHASPYTGNYSQKVHLRTHLYNGGSHNVLTAYGLNVGIGTTSPESKLHVVSGAGEAGFLSRGASGDTWFPYTNGQNYIRGVTNFDNASVYFTGGNIGIGTSSPSEKLHVSGAAIFDGGSGNSSTDAVVYVTKSNNNDWGLYVNASGLDYGVYTRVSPSANYAFAIHNGTTWTTRFTGDGRLHLNQKDTIASYDSWLRLNQSGEYGSGVYTPYTLRNDGPFDNYGGIYGYSGIRGRKAQTANNYTTAALWTESYDNTATGIAFHISGNVGKFLEMRTDGILYWENQPVIFGGNIGSYAWTSANDGAGSGLDADLLDGQHASAFAAASHNHDDRYYTETESDAKYLIGTTNPGTPGNFTLSIGNNGTYSYVQSHSSQPLRLNPLGNALEGPSGSTIWHSGNDGAGSGLDADTLDGLHASSFLTAESDTLNSVTGRGNTTSNSVRFGSHVDLSPNNSAFRFYDGTTFRGGLGLDDWAHSGSAANITAYVEGNNNFFISTSGVKRAQFNSGAAVFRTYSADTAYNIRITGGDQFNAYYNDSVATLYLQYHNGNGGTLNVGNGKLTVNTAGSVVASGDMRAPIFYDSNDTNYYLDLSSSSNSSYAAGVFRQNNGKYVRDSSYRTYSGYSDYYSAGNAGWYRVAEITLTANCSGAVLYGTLYDHRYDGADAYQISIVARAECNFTSNNDSHYINVGCTILGSTAFSSYQSKIRVLLVASSSGSRTYEVQFYETNWNHDTWQLETNGWTVYTTPQAPGSSTGTAMVNYVSNQNADFQRANAATYSPIYYDSQDTGYYLDPNGTSNLLQLTTATRARWNMPRVWYDRSSRTTDQGYWTGTNGWTTEDGTWATAWKGGFSGWDIWGTNTDHPQGAGSIHAQGIVSGQHYATSGVGYGWMMVGAHAATDNRYWLRGKWDTTTSGWVEMITTGNIGSQSVNYAATAGNVAWTGVTAGRRTNYDLGFEAPSAGYAGFSFTTPGGAAENAGYFLIRGGADNDVYTQNGITLVADAGWLSLAQRTTAGKGVRIMSGTTSTTRMSFNADGTTYLYTDLYLGSTNTRITATDASGYVRLYGSAGNYLALGPYNNNGWVYFENSANASGIYFNSPGRYAFDSVDLTPYNDAENSLGNGSYRWSQVYTSGWFRNYSTNGLYNESYGNHWYATSNSTWNAAGNNGSYVEIAMRTGGHQGSVRGYFYADSSANIGILNNAGNWSLLTNSSRNTTLYGQLTVGEGIGYSSIYMTDSDEGTREIHCNSNRIGFLTQAGAWGAYLDDSTNWFAVGSVQAPIFYDSDDTNYYVDPNGYSRIWRTSTHLAPSPGVGSSNWVNDFNATPTSSMSFGGDLSSGGPQGTWWFQQNFRHSNPNNYWGTQVAWGWEDNANELWQRNVTGGSWSSWVRYINTNNYAGILDARYYTETEVNSLLSGYVTTTYNSSLNSDSRNSRGVTRLYRRDDDSDFSVQTHWTGSYWWLRGYNGDTFHAEVRVAYADFAASTDSATFATQVVTIQDNPPTGANGKLWWESDTGKLKVYYSSSSAWVDATPVPDMSLYYAKAGGPINGDVTVQQTLTVVGNTLIQGTLTETSDISLKENIVPLESSLDKVMQLNGVSFNKKATPNVKEIGFIAQEVEAVIPDLVTETSEGIKTVSYSRVTAVLVETIKEQQAQIEELKNMVNMLAEKLNNL